MNSTDKRIEELLNRAGQTISDLPRKQGESVSEPYSGEECWRANGTAWKWYLNVDIGMYDYDSTGSKMILKLYILHLTDIIDRLETALDNVCGERDYLAYRMRRHMDCQSCGWIGTCDKTPDHCKGWVFGGVPEGLSADDE